jgi:1-acyl-sn-glycerol-3-phosphate acyltransferase
MMTEPDTVGAGAVRALGQGFRRVLWLAWIWFSLGVLLFYLKVLTRSSFEGLENVPASGRVLVVSNHISDLDPVVIPAAILTRYPTQLIRAVGKAELFRVPILRRLIRSYRVISVERSGRDLRAIREIIKAMRSGKVLIFPEGTRTDGGLQPGKRPIGGLVHAARPVVIPTVVWGTNRAIPPWELVGKRVRIGQRLGVRFGKPLDLQGLLDRPSSQETRQAITDVIMSGIRRLQEEVKAEGRF